MLLVKLLAVVTISIILCDLPPYPLGTEAIAEAKQLISSSAINISCQNLTGSYSFYGEALPGMPTYFRFKNLLTHQ